MNLKLIFLLSLILTSTEIFSATKKCSVHIGPVDYLNYATKEFL